MKTATTALAKYVFVDVVNYTKNRSVEAQSDIIDALNAMVARVFEELKIPKEERIMLPTGDGMCVAFLNYNFFDINMIFSFKLLGLIQERNKQERDEARRFKVRLGINENQDNLVRDINGVNNLAGSGINLAQRVMDMGDDSQMLLGHASYEVLRCRELYMKHFREFIAHDKHGDAFYVYQFVDEELSYLNSATPEAFRSSEITSYAKPPLTDLVAWTIALAQKRRDFFMAKKDEARFAHVANTLLYHLALDEISRKKSTPFKKHRFKAYKAGFASLDDQFNYYKTQDFNLIAVLADFIDDKHYKAFHACFEGEGDQKTFAFPTAEGLRRLREEFPELEESPVLLKASGQSA
jgi:class 3 adenylate cyclase